MVPSPCRVVVDDDGIVAEKMYSVLIGTQNYGVIYVGIQY